MSVPLSLGAGHETGLQCLRQPAAGCLADDACPATACIVNRKASDYKLLGRVIA